MPTGFILRTKGTLKYLTIPAFEATGLVKHCFTTRQGGVSAGAFASLNLGAHLTDEPEKVIKNRALMLSALGLESSQMVAAQQIHGKAVLTVTAKDKGRGAYSNEEAIPNTDALITNESGVALTTYYADCVPLYILDPVRKAIALAHAGWKGTVLKIASVTIEKMALAFGSRPKDLLVGIGPSIGPCCYEVDKKVLREFELNFTKHQKLLSAQNADKAKLNLWAANKQVFLEAGVPEANITVAELCTSCHHDLFFSYRKEQGHTGRMAAIMCL